MKNIIIFILILFITSFGFTQSGFKYQLTFPQGNNITCVSDVNDNIFFGVGSYGTFIRSTDGGLNWFVLHFVNNLNTSFSSVIFPSANTGFLCSSNGHILKTVNSGTNWVTQSSGVSSSLNTIHFYSNDYGVAAGTVGVILVTTNSGLNWIQKPYYSNVSFNSIFLPSQNTGYIGGSNGVLLKTTNGGSNWDSVYGNSGSIRKLFFVNNITGFLCGNNVIRKTVNGGLLWDSIAPYSCNSVEFINENTGFFTSSYYKIYKTTDGGNTFTSQSLNSGFDNLYATGISSNGSGIAAGFKGYIYKTTDYGNNWSAKFKAHNEYISYLKYDNPDRGMFVDRMGSVSRTYDGGNNYVQISQPGAYILTGFCFEDSLTGYGVGANGRIMKTENAGVNWVQMTSGITTSLHKVQFKGGLGLAVGYYGIILRTNNQGINWTSQTSTTNNWLKNVYIQNGNIAFVCGENQILKSTDAGVTWQSKTVGMSLDMQCIHTPNGGNVWAGGDKIFYSSNSGDNWVLQFSPEYPINTIEFLSGSVGYAAGNSGYVIKTTNGGLNWNKLQFPYGGDLYAMEFINEDVGWIAGNGVLLKTSTGGNVFIRKFTGEVPSGFELEQNYPNPFNAVTNVKFQVPSLKFIKLVVFDLLGREVKTLVNEVLQPGTYNVSFDAGDLPSGIYFYQMRTNDFSETKKLILLK